MTGLPTRFPCALRLGALVLLLALGSACDSVDPTKPSAVEILSGHNQTAQVGTALPEPLVVRVTNADGTPLPGVEVRWQDESGDGALRPFWMWLRRMPRRPPTFQIGRATCEAPAMYIERAHGGQHAPAPIRLPSDLEGST